MINPFFKNQGPFKIEDILHSSNTGNKNNYTGSKIIDIKDLVTATNNDIIELVQSSCSLAVSLMIFIKVFDFQSYMSSVKKKRLELKKQREKREFEKMKVLIEAMKKDNLDDISLSTDDEAEEKQEPLRMTRKKKQKLTPNENAV